MASSSCETLISFTESVDHYDIGDIADFWPRVMKRVAHIMIYERNGMLGMIDDFDDYNIHFQFSDEVDDSETFQSVEFYVHPSTGARALLCCCELPIICHTLFRKLQTKS